MSQDHIEPKKVFISYSWTTQEHQTWVLDLATRLTEDGVDVILDKWDLREGQDTTFFMEGMRKADKVLIICDQGYASKANARKGGVGTETQIITPEIYGDVEQQKFIPIIAERDENGKHLIPIFIESRLYVDLSDVDLYEENYEQLLRSIYQRPLHKKPSLGKAPSYLFEDEPDHHKTSSIIRQMKSSSDRNPSRLKHQWNDFADEFFISLSEYRIDQVDNPSELDELVVQKIDKLLFLRNDFIVALELMVIHDFVETDQLIEFFEKLYSFTCIQNSGTYYEEQFDHFKFLTTELFLYASVILLKARKYVELSQLLNADYYVGKEGVKDYTNFRFYIASFEIRKKRLNSNKISLQADKLVNRSSEKYKSDLISTDMLLHIISKVTIVNADQWKFSWFPVTYIYLREQLNLIVKPLVKLNSRAHFENIKILFNVHDIEEFRIKVDSLEPDKGYSDSWLRYVPSIKTFIKVEDIGSKP